MKWGFIPQDNPNPKYLVVNADESEPGTCKDIPLMMASPHTLVEGVIISSYAIRANTAFIYVRGEVLHVVRRLQAAVAEAYDAGHLGKDIHGSGYDLDIIVHAGAGAYICGEETALLDSLEGRRGQPRLRPPFPAVAGLYAVADGHQQRRVDRVGALHRRQRRRLVLLDGHREEQGHDALLAVRPREAARASTRRRSGITLRELLDLAGGVREGHELKFWTPGGSSTPLLTAEHLDVPLDYEGVGAAGSMLGTKALQIFDETTCVVRAVLRWTEFYKHESCGKCTPCREGTWWLVQVLAPARAGAGHRGRPRAAARPVRQHPRPVVLRARRRCDEPDHVVDPVLPRRVPRPPRARRLPVRPGGLHACSHPRRAAHDVRMTADGGRAGQVEQTDLVTLTIDGIEISVPKGTLVIRAAEQIGVQIPRFCDHPLLAPVGACRQAMRRAASLLCLVGALLGTLGLLPARAQEGGPVVEVFEASGVLDASVLGALRRDLEGAERRGARVFLIQLSSFGGLGVDPAEVQATVADAGVPVAVWVGPRSADAAGAAAFLLAEAAWSGWRGTPGSGRRSRPSWGGGATRAPRPPCSPRPGCRRRCSGPRSPGRPPRRPGWPATRPSPCPTRSGGSTASRSTAGRWR